MPLPSDEVLAEFVRESNRIEEEPTEPGHPLYDDHMTVAKQIRGLSTARGT